MNKFICILFTFLFSGCVSYNVMHVADNKEKVHNKNGFYYNLPQTAIKVDVTVKQTIKIKGPYADYAEKFLGLKNVIKENVYNYNIVNINISSFNQRDPEQFYHVSTHYFLHRHNGLFVNISEDGMIESINSPDKIDTKLPNSRVLYPELAKNEEGSQFVIEGNLREKIDTVIEKIINNDTLSIEKKILKKSLVEKSIEQKAKECADYLIKIKADKYSIITGISEVNYSKESLEFMINQLNKLEREYLALFKGDTSSILIHYSFSYLPKKSETQDIPLFVFSQKKGVIKNLSSAGEVVALTITKSEETTCLNKFQSQIDKEPAKCNGFYYRIPEFAKVSIHKGSSVLAELNLPVCQFGIVSHLPHKIKRVLFYPNSGTLKRLKD